MSLRSLAGCKRGPTAVGEFPLLSPEGATITDSGTMSRISTTISSSGSVSMFDGPLRADIIGELRDAILG